MSRTAFKIKEADKLTSAGLPELPKPSTTRIEKIVGEKTYFMEVVKPSILSYRLYSKLIATDVYGAIDKFVNGCIVKSSPECGSNDNLIDDSIKVLFIDDISKMYLQQVNVAFGVNECSLDSYVNEFNELAKSHLEIYTVYIDDKVLFLKKPNRVEFKELFNAQLDSAMESFELCYTLLRIGGCVLDVDKDQETFIACSNVTDRIISNKFFELKKK
jgi:hypothetical protein